MTSHQPPSISYRKSNYKAVSTALTSLSDQQLLDLLAKGKHRDSSIGGTAVSLEVENTPVFAKKIALTELELRSEKFKSTSNLFSLPAHLHYGVGTVGSPGFGAWRELSAHLAASEWVLQEECPNFPVLYHWRVLPTPASAQPPEEHRDVDRAVKYWGGSPAVRERIEAIAGASASLVLFLEFFPTTLWDWLGKRVSDGDESARDAFSVADAELESTTAFMRSRGFVHFDAHFGNLLTDGSRLYFTDFGLAASRRFQLSDDESTFLESHLDYDRQYTTACLVSRLASLLFGTKNREAVLDELSHGSIQRSAPTWVKALMSKHAPVAVGMKEFIRKFQLDTRSIFFHP